MLSGAESCAQGKEEERQIGDQCGPPLGCSAPTLALTSSRSQPVQIRMTFWHPTSSRRQPSQIRMTFWHPTRQAAAEAQVTEMCQKLLANPVIEDFRFELEDAPPG